MCFTYKSNPPASISNDNMAVSPEVDMSTQAIVVQSMKTDHDASLLGQKSQIVPLMSRLTSLPPTLTVDRMNDKFVAIANMTWNAASAAASVIGTLSLPAALSNNGTEPMNSMMNLHRLMNFDIELQILLNGSPFQAGLAVAVWQPCYPVIMNIQSILAFPHVFLSPSSTNPVALDCVFNCPYDALLNYRDNTLTPSNFLNQLGALVVYVFSPLNVAAGTSTFVPITILCRYKSSAMCVTGPSRAPQFTQITQSGKTDSSVTQLIEGLGQVAKVVGPLLGTLDQPALTCPDRVRKTFSDATHGDGAVGATRLNVRQDLIHNVDMASLGTTTDEMDLNVLKKIPGFVNSVSVANSVSYGTLLNAWVVDPFLGTSASQSGGNTTADFTPLGYISFPFALWRGSMTLTVKIVATAMQRGRIMVAYNPATLDNVPTFGAALSGITSVLDFTGSQNFDIEIPYVARNKWLRVRDYTNVLDITSTLNSTGYLTMWSLNVATNATGIPPSFSILSYISGGDDFSLQVPASHLRLYTFVSGEQLGSDEVDKGFSLSTQSGEIASTDRGGREKEVASTSLPMMLGEMRLGYLDPNQHMNLQRLLRRPMFRTTFNSTDGTSSTGTWTRFYSGIPSPGEYSSNSLSFLVHFANMYRFFVGNMRFCFMTNANATTPGMGMICLANPTSTTDSFAPVTQINPNLADFQYPFNVSTERAVEVISLWRVPYTKVFASPYSLTSTAFATYDIQMVSSCAVEFWLTGAPVLYVTVLVSLSDESRLTTFIGPRTLTWVT